MRNPYSSGHPLEIQHRRFSCWVTVLDNGHAWRFDVKPLAKIDGRIVELLIRRRGPEIQVVALGLALKTTERVFGKVRRE
jgi:hypothetical protein